MLEIVTSSPLTPSTLTEARRLAKRGLESAAAPRESDEMWRYSGMDRFSLSAFESDAAPEEVVDCVVDVPESALALGVVAAADELVSSDPSYFSLVGEASLVSAVVVTVPPNVTLPEPIRVRTVVNRGGVAGVRLRVAVGANAAATVIEEFRSSVAHVGSGTSALISYATAVELGPGANLQHASVQLLGDHDWAVGSIDAGTARDATFSSVAVALGGKYARVETRAAATEPGAHNELLAVYFAGNEQVHDFRTRQHHIAPRTTSDLLFKGAVEDSARSVYSGMIQIGKDARRTVANQTNRNLLLSPNASAESVPNLEIENNDVKCSHASAIGPIDDDHRYYLESRGVSPSEADRLIVLGFFADLLERVPDARLRTELVQAVGEKFDRRQALERLS